MLKKLLRETDKTSAPSMKGEDIVHAIGNNGRNMNKAGLAEAGPGSPPFYTRISILACTKGLEVGGERWEELLVFHIHPLSFV